LEAFVAMDRDKSAGVAGGDIEGSCLVTPFAGHGEEGHANEEGHAVCPCQQTACKQAPMELAVTAATFIAVRAGSCGDAGTACAWVVCVRLGEVLPGQPEVADCGTPRGDGTPLLLCTEACSM